MLAVLKAVRKCCSNSGAACSMSGMGLGTTTFFLMGWVFTGLMSTGGAIVIGVSMIVGISMVLITGAVLLGSTFLNSMFLGSMFLNSELSSSIVFGVEISGSDMT